jgi:hypothetical protein
MALTMTRTRTQTTLTKLAEMVANLHGELEFVDGLLACNMHGQGMVPEVRTQLVARRRKLASDRDALYTTVRQFDNRIDPGGIGSADGWRKRYGRGLGEAGLMRRYLHQTDS